MLQFYADSKALPHPISQWICGVDNAAYDHEPFRTSRLVRSLHMYRRWLQLGFAVFPVQGWMHLGELGHEGNHEIEKTDGLDESETKNGVGEELATEGGVAGNAVEEGGEDKTDTNTGTGKTDGSGTHTKVLGDLNHGLGDLGRVGALLESLAGGGVDDGAHLGALEGLERGASLDGALADLSNADSRAGNLSGSSHLGGQARGEDTSGGHFVYGWVYSRRDTRWTSRERLRKKLEEGELTAGLLE
jgi:hypothetical protein